jgi:phenylacetate-CoA ligase
MIKYLAKHIGYPLKDLKTGSPIRRTQKIFEESQYWSREKLEEYQVLKLRKLVSHAFENVPYYSELFRAHGISPGDIKDLRDLPKIPVLDKETARIKNLELVSRNLRRNGYFEAKTGGTTGPPLIVFKDKKAYAADWAITYRWQKWLGIEKGDPVAIFWGASSVLSQSYLKGFSKNLSDYLRNQRTFNSFNLNEENYRKIISELKRFRPVLIKGYLSSILQLGGIIEKHGLSGEIKPRAIVTTSETLYPNLREYIEDIYQCPVFDQYGCGEINAIANECSFHEGLHINVEHVIVEVSEQNSFQHPDSGKLIITDLDDHSMPFIRYVNGDVGTLGHNDCSCGRQLPMLKSVEGRIADSIVLKNGSRVHGVFFTDILYEIDRSSARYIKLFQVFQEKEGEIEFRYVPDQVSGGKYIQTLEKMLSRFFNRVRVIPCESIPPDSNGKFRYIVSEV